jgi:hypothetical protein
MKLLERKKLRLMKQKEINKILKENKDLFDALENYDKTGKIPKINKKIPENKIIEEAVKVYLK